MPRPFGGRLLAAALLLPLIAGACTSKSSSTGDPTGASTPVAGVTGASNTASTTTSAAATSPAGPTTIPTTIPTTTIPSTPPIPDLLVSVAPADGAADVSPTAPVRVKVQHGRLTTVTMTNPEGRPAKGTVAADRTSWTSTEPLGYGRTYAVSSTAVDPAGRKRTTTSRFTTLRPAETIYPSFFPNPGMKTVGVGQPMVVIFDKPPADRATAEKALRVTTVPAVSGAWYWWDDRTVHYRAKDYWKPGTRITVSAKIYGVDLGGGAYGETDRAMTVTIGPSKVAQVDDATKQMKVFVDGKLTKTYPVSLGMNKQVTVDGTDISFVTPSGTYVAQEKYVVKQMSSATYGLPVDSSLGYDSKIPLAVRFSNEGIFVHAAPWSVADQGVRNVSHGCINMPPAGGQWFYDNFGYGDILTVKGTATRLAPTDGYGDWNVSWEKWLTGSALT